MRKILQRYILFISIITISSARCYGQVGTIVDSIQSNFSTSAIGIACVGNDLWITGSSFGYIYKISNTGQLSDSIPDPAASQSDYSEGIASDGIHLWVCCYTCDTFYQIDIATKLVSGTYVGLSLDERVSIAYNGNDKLYFANGSDNNGSFIFDIPTHTFMTWGSSVFARGFTFINGKLYGTYSTSMPDQAHIFEADTVTGNFLTMDDWCVNDLFGGLGMSYDGNYIWQSTVNSNYIYKILFNPALAVPEVSNDNDFMITGNPVHNELRLITANENISSIEIFNVIGMNLISTGYQRGQIIDVSSLAPGVYFLKAFCDGNSFPGIKKFIVENRE